eukprot:753656-Hanusia_phi.AAC.12
MLARVDLFGGRTTSVTPPCLCSSTSSSENCAYVRRASQGAPLFSAVRTKVLSDHAANQALVDGRAVGLVLGEPAGEVVAGLSILPPHHDHPFGVPSEELVAVRGEADAGDRVLVRPAALKEQVQREVRRHARLAAEDLGPGELCRDQAPEANDSRLMSADDHRILHCPLGDLRGEIRRWRKGREVRERIQEEGEAGSRRRTRTALAVVTVSHSSSMNLLASNLPFKFTTRISFPAEMTTVEPVGFRSMQAGVPCRWRARGLKNLSRDDHRVHARDQQTGNTVFVPTQPLPQHHLLDLGVPMPPDAVDAHSDSALCHPLQSCGLGIPELPHADVPQPPTRYDDIAIVAARHGGDAILMEILKLVLRRREQDSVPRHDTRPAVSLCPHVSDDPLPCSHQIPQRLALQRRRLRADLRRDDADPLLALRMRLGEELSGSLPEVQDLGYGAHALHGILDGVHVNGPLVREVVEHVERLDSCRAPLPVAEDEVDPLMEMGGDVLALERLEGQGDNVR